MLDAKARDAQVNAPSKKNFSFVLLLLIMIVVVVYALSRSGSPRAGSLPPGTTSISRATLEDKYGLQVRLVAVTAAGGFVDLRLKILDAEKAGSLLQNSSNYPALFIDGQTTLHAFPAEKERELRLEQGGGLFILFPNTVNRVKPGMPIRILFGNLALEPVSAQ